MKTTNYFQTFIQVAEDCPAQAAAVPPHKDPPSVAELQFRMVYDHPYTYTSDEVLFRIHALRKNIPKGEQEAAQAVFFSKGQACFRASPLPKRYGWGVHYNEEGRMALYAVETPEYRKLAQDPALKQWKAMRNGK
ncbi:MAG TPA: DUF6157 family protein [Chitinophagaceae bacterium]|jgi:hypothetical protein|nr:DUF6157 family protein [Chitinophagaceae bacterium]